jgi:hypothetical protein
MPWAIEANMREGRSLGGIGGRADTRIELAVCEERAHHVATQRRIP